VNRVKSIVEAFKARAPSDLGVGVSNLDYVGNCARFLLWGSAVSFSFDVEVNLDAILIREFDSDDPEPLLHNDLNCAEIYEQAARHIVTEFLT